jgi:hypothetical protein
MGSAFHSESAIIKGQIRNQKNEPLGFANIIVKENKIGTTSNDNGFYELKLNAGTYTLSFQYIGYKVTNKQVVISENETTILNISLEPQSFSLSEVDVKASAEDPAYPIMRRALAMRKVYLFEPKEYQCTAYLKGMQRLTTVPKRVILFKVPADLKPGIVYLSESLSELSFQQPHKINERMISSKVSGSNKAFSFNRAGSIEFNLYENNINTFGLNERGFISPLATNAFIYYNYKLEGESKENGLTIYKIKIIPIRNNDPVFRGYIYIIKDSWRLHSTDLLLNKSSGIEFVDTLYIKQIYAKQDGGTWMPISQRFIFQLEIYGLRGNGYFVALYSNYKINSMYPSSFYSKQEEQITLNEKIPETKKISKVKVTKRTEKDSSLFPKKFFNNEVMIIDKNANKNNDAIWDSIRPIPLTDDEKVDYKQKDSEEVIHNSKPYKDSIDKLNNRLNISGFIVTGYTYKNSYKDLSFSLSPPLSVIQFNTIEGFVFNPLLSIRKKFEDNRSYTITPNFRYGFSSNRLFGRVNTLYISNAIKRTTWQASGGWFVEQFNSNDPISPTLNTCYSLLAVENFLKLYEKKYINISYSSEIVNGLTINSSIEYAQRNALSNTSNYTFNNFSDRSYTSNVPYNTQLLNNNFETNNALKFNLDVHIVFAQKYITRPNRKFNFGSNYPELNLGYTKGINGLGSVVNFDKITENLTYYLDMKLFGESNFDIRCGQFINNSNLYFMDYQHFNGNRTIISANDFQLLDYYLYSTNQTYFEAHYNHHFNGFFFNKFPLIRKLKWQEVFSINYLKTNNSPNYIEFGIGIEHVFKFMRVDLFTSYENGIHQRNGIVLGLGF